MKHLSLLLIPAALVLFPLASSLHAQGAAKPVSLFDGKSLDGWNYDKNFWRVEDGAITGGFDDKKVPRNDFISTKKNFPDFELKLKIKCSGDPKTGMINSGIQIRSVRVPNDPHLCGYQVDCGKGWFGKIYDEFRRRKVIAEPVDAEALAKAVDIQGWNDYRIRAEGPRIRVWINDVLATDFTETDKNIALDGHIGIQVHGGGHCLVQAKDITIQELPPTKDAPTWESLGGVEAAIKLVAPARRKKPAPKPKAKAKAIPPKKTRGGKDISYNAVQGKAQTAAEQLKQFHLPEGYEIELVVQESEGLGKFVALYFDQRGRMWTQTALEYPVDANENRAVAEALYKSKARDKILVYPREALNEPLPPGGLTNPTVFADGLAIPLGILPWSEGDSCYSIHGADLVLLTDTDGDGVSDKREVVLTGFGIEDSHLFPHQFTRAPGGWIWMAQGLFNYSNVKLPGDDKVVPYPKCSLARMRPDGTGFEVTTIGPNNIWGLATNIEGETFIQEANDYGYPVMPLHEYAYYPGGMKALTKSYQPDFPPAAQFRMGGTGLSGLALLEKGSRQVIKADQTMLVANPIISKVQTLAMFRDGPYWRLAQMPDFITCEDPLFRPVAMTQGPDGAIYIVDWYNKIISHNEVPRSHPDRDKTRGRIWRVRSVHGDIPGTAPPGEKPGVIRHGVPDFTALTDEQLIDMLGKRPAARSHFAWQTLLDRNDEFVREKLKEQLTKGGLSDADIIQRSWILGDEAADALEKHTTSSNRNVRRELARLKAFGEKLLADPDPEVRFVALQTVYSQIPEKGLKAVAALLGHVKPSLPGKTAAATRGSGQIPARESYDREFERFLVRFFLERHSDEVAEFLDSEDATNLSVEARVMAALALDPKTSASRIATLLPKLDRPPNAEELMRLAQFPGEPGCGEALEALLANPKTRAHVASQLLQQKTKLDPKKIAPSLTKAARALLQGEESTTAVELIGAFQLQDLESDLVGTVMADKDPEEVLACLQALRQLKSRSITLFADLAEKATDPRIRDEAIASLAESAVPSASRELFLLYPDFDAVQRRNALTAVSSHKIGAKNLVTALRVGRIPKTDLDGPTAERLSAVLGKDPDLAELMDSLGHVFRDVLLLNGKGTAWADSKITLDGSFTVETWVRLAPNIHNHDGILGAPGVLDMNFFSSNFRVWIGGGSHDVVVSNKPMTPDFWTHVAVTRDHDGNFKIYTNGELDAAGTKKAPGKFENLRVGHTNPKEGTHGALAEFRIWDHERSAEEILANFDRSFAASDNPDGLVFYNAGGDKSWGKLGKGASVAKTTDLPPVLTQDQAAALDKKFAHYMKLGRKGGNIENGKMLSMLCIACHVVDGKGGQIGPDLSGAGAMGIEGVLRNLLNPNAAMEAGYRIYRVELKNGDIIDAFFVSQDRQAVVIRQQGLPDRRIPKKDIRSTRYIRRSLMPEGLLDGMNDEQIADLLAYLMTLK